jgi:hypothetical protein
MRREGLQIEGIPTTEKARPAPTLVRDWPGPFRLVGPSRDGTLVPTSRPRRHSHQLLVVPRL